MLSEGDYHYSLFIARALKARESKWFALAQLARGGLVRSGHRPLIHLCLSIQGIILSCLQASTISIGGCLFSVHIQPCPAADSRAEQTEKVTGNSHGAPVGEKAFFYTPEAAM